MLRHLLWPGSAIDAKHRHIESMDDRGRSADIGADQQRARGLDGDLHRDRQIPRRLDQRPACAVDCSLDLQHVLHGLDDDAVDTAVDKPAGLDGKRLLKAVVIDLAEGCEARARADRAEHEVLAAVKGTVGDGLASDFRGAAVEHRRLFGEIKLGERQRRAAETVGQQDIGACEQVIAVVIADDLRAGAVEHLGTVLTAVVIAHNVQVERLHVATHAAIEQQHTLGQGVEE